MSGNIQEMCDLICNELNVKELIVGGQPGLSLTIGKETRNVQAVYKAETKSFGLMWGHQLQGYQFFDAPESGKRFMIHYLFPREQPSV